MINLNLKISSNMYKKGFPDLEHYSNSTLDDFFSKNHFWPFVMQKKENSRTLRLFLTRVQTFPFFVRKLRGVHLAGPILKSSYEAVLR